MKRLSDSRKIFNANPKTTLAELKVSYRNFMKEWHPDKFRDDDAQLELAEAKSKTIIEAYHFLVSISPETHQTNSAEYALTTNSAIDDYEYKSSVLKIKFQNGSEYEYFGVPISIYNKMANSSGLSRFARRHIFNSFTHRIISKKVETV